MWKLILAGCFLIITSTCVVINGESYNLVKCEDTGGECQKPEVDLEVEEVSSKVLEFENEAVSKAVAVLQSLGFTHAFPKKDDGFAHGDKTHLRKGRLFDFDWAAQAALSVLNMFGFDGSPLSNIPVPVPILEKFESPDVCKMSDYKPCRAGDGLCTSPSSCASSGGKSLGRCSGCMGCSTCCQYLNSCQGSTDKLISYFQSPSYPSTDMTHDGCSLTITIGKEVSQIRLDFLDFEMPHPLGGVCADRLQIINSAQSGGVFGPGNNDLCGLNTGQHVYLPVDPGNLVILRAVTSGVLNVPLAPVSGRSRGLSGDTHFRWNIKITQIPSKRRPFPNFNMECDESVPRYFRELEAPEGCDQYHMKSRGTIKSLNFDGISEINLNYDYSICVKRPVDTCGVTLKAISFSLPASPVCLPGDVNVDIAAGALCCTVPFLTERQSPRFSANLQSLSIPVSANRQSLSIPVSANLRPGQHPSPPVNETQSQRVTDRPLVTERQSTRVPKRPLVKALQSPLTEGPVSERQYTSVTEQPRERQSPSITEHQSTIVTKLPSPVTRLPVTKLHVTKRTSPLVKVSTFPVTERQSPPVTAERQSPPVTDRPVLIVTETVRLPLPVTVRSSPSVTERIHLPVTERTFSVTERPPSELEVQRPSLSVTERLSLVTESQSPHELAVEDYWDNGPFAAVATMPQSESAVPFNYWEYGPFAAVALTQARGGRSFAGPPRPGVNYLGFPGFSDGTRQGSLVPNAGRFNNGQNQYSSLPKLQKYYFCGEALGNPATNLVVARVKGPLVVKVRTSDSYWGPNQFAVDPVSKHCPQGGCIGFNIMYDVETGSC